MLQKSLVSQRVIRSTQRTMYLLNLIDMNETVILTNNIRIYEFFNVEFQITQFVLTFTSTKHTYLQCKLRKQDLN